MISKSSRDRLFQTRARTVELLIAQGMSYCATHDICYWPGAGCGNCDQVNLYRLGAAQNKQGLRRCEKCGTDHDEGRFDFCPHELRT